MDDEKSTLPLVPAKAPVISKPGLNRVFFRQFGAIWKIMFSCQYRWIYVLFAALIITAALKEVVVYFTGLVPSHFYSAFLGNDKGAFATAIGWACLLFTAITLVSFKIFLMPLFN